MARVPKLLSQVLEAGGSIVGLRGGAEEPHYTVEHTIDGVEIRRYGARIAAETTVVASENAARNAGFRRLAGYIFGANHDRTTIAMTAPVAQEPSDAATGTKIAMTAPVSQFAGPDNTSVIRFFMPAEWTLETLPEPNDETVKLVTVPAETVAVLRFTGSRSPAVVASRKVELLKALQNTVFQPTGAPVAWFYDPPWTVPFCRRNEVTIPVTMSDHGEP